MVLNSKSLFEGKLKNLSSEKADGVEGERPVKKRTKRQGKVERKGKSSVGTVTGE